MQRENRGFRALGGGVVDAFNEGFARVRALPWDFVVKLDADLSFDADAHYHHVEDDVIVGGKLPYSAGAIAVPTAPGLGVKLDREKLGRYHELFQKLGSYPYDQDPLRPGWSPLIPNDRWADPNDGRTPEVPA